MLCIHIIMNIDKYNNFFKSLKNNVDSIDAVKKTIWKTVQNP